MNDLIKAKLVYDQNTIATPSDMLPEGKTEAEAYTIIREKNQLQGTDPEKLTELSGRVCYGSLGAGRNSPDYHKHIQEVGHLSVCEHFNFTVGFRGDRDDEIAAILGALINRPGLWVVPKLENHEIQVTLNLRSVLEWEKIDTDFPKSAHTAAVGRALKKYAHLLAPAIVPRSADTGFGNDTRLVHNDELVSDQQKWVSLFMAGSRGWSHEQVRHGDRTAISQRSTRYVDENSGEWIDHPLIDQFFAAGMDTVHRAPNGEATEISLKSYLSNAKSDARRAYIMLVDKLQPWLISKGVDKFTARKQARGAARGYLGNALSTEMIFSASVAQWKLILGQRLNAAADAEIREVSYKALAELKRSAWGKSFESFVTKPSPDGIGHVLA